MCCVCAFHVRLYSSISAGGTVTDRPTSNAERTAGNSQRSSRSLGCGGHSCFAVSRARGDAPFRRRCFAWLERCGGAEPPRHKKSRAVNALVCVVGLHSLLFWLSSTLPSAERFFFLSTSARKLSSRAWLDNLFSPFTLTASSHVYV